MKGEFVLSQIEGLQKSLNYATRLLNEVWLLCVKAGLWKDSNTMDDLPGLVRSLVKKSGNLDLDGYRMAAEYEAMVSSMAGAMHQLSKGTETILIMPIGPVRGAVIVDTEENATACAAAHPGVMVVALGAVRGWVSEVIRRQLAAVPVILVALPINRDEGEKVGPGRAAVAVWLREYRQARYWPVPVGNDLGDYVKEHGGDLGVWIEAGLPSEVFASTAMA